MEYTGCSHYRRKALLQCPLPRCSAWVSCRFCHDAEHYEKGDPKLQHQLERKAVANVRCTRCSLEQAPQRECRGCGLVLGDYFCAVCVLYDDEGAKKGLWHCDGCGLCRAGEGGRDAFFHCDGAFVWWPLSRAPGGSRAHLRQPQPPPSSLPQGAARAFRRRCCPSARGTSAPAR